MSIEKKIKEINRREKLAELGGGEERIAQRHASGKLTARERILLLLDEGSFQETDKFVVHQSQGLIPGLRLSRPGWHRASFGHSSNQGRQCLILRLEVLLLLPKV